MEILITGGKNVGKTITAIRTFAEIYIKYKFEFNSQVDVLYARNSGKRLIDELNINKNINPVYLLKNDIAIVIKIHMADEKERILIFYSYGDYPNSQNYALKYLRYNGDLIFAVRDNFISNANLNKVCKNLTKYTLTKQKTANYQNNTPLDKYIESNAKDIMKHLGL